MAEYDPYQDDFVNNGEGITIIRSHKFVSVMRALIYDTSISLKARAFVMCVQNVFDGVDLTIKLIRSFDQDMDDIEYAEIMEELEDNGFVTYREQEDGATVITFHVPPVRIRNV